MRPKHRTDLERRATGSFVFSRVAVVSTYTCVCVDVQGHTHEEKQYQSINQIDYVSSNQETTTATIEVKF